MRSTENAQNRIEVEGLERPLVNEVVLTAHWLIDKSWPVQVSKPYQPFGVEVS